MSPAALLDKQREAASDRARKLAQLADHLLAQLHRLDARSAEAMRAEARRLFTTAYDITAALAYGESDIGCDEVGGTSRGAA